MTRLRISSFGLAFLLRRDRPNLLVRSRVIARLFDPTDHLDFRNAARDALFVGLCRPILQRLEQLIGFPLLSVVILYIPGIVEANHDEPLLAALARREYGAEQSLTRAVSHREHQARRFR